MARAVLGVDPSLSSTGVALMVDGGPFVTWVLTTSSGDALPARLAELAADVTACAESALRPALAVVERGFSGGKGPSAWLNGCAAGALIGALEGAGVRCVLVPPKVRAKLATGKGTADKLDVLDAARARLGYVGKSFDEADALWLGVMGMALGGWDLPKLPQAHLEVVEQYRAEAERLGL